MEYAQKQLEIRQKVLSLYYNANAGHIGSSLSCIDLLIALFEQKQENERVILSKGHAAAAMYCTLNHYGEIDDETISTFYKNGTKLSAHPSANSFENIPFALGSLGHGFPIACGIANANKLLGNNEYVYVIMSDGDTNEGTTWEAAHFAVSRKLSQLMVVIDKNNLQGFGQTSDILGDTANPAVWSEIGFEVVEVDGHDLIRIMQGIRQLKASSGKPKLLLANTIKGKGVDYMENKMEWHYLPMSAEQYELALNSLLKNYHA